MEQNIQSKDKVEGFTEEQKNFIEYDKNGKSVILSSTAGSGKSFSCVHRLKFLLSQGVDPKKIIFFSFTVAAVEELKGRVQNDNIKITTIHAFCQHLLYRMGKAKKISSFYDFIDWYKNTHKPKEHSSVNDKLIFWEKISKLYEDADYLSVAITAYKLQLADGIKSKLPQYWHEYNRFLKETKARDFSDMLIEVHEALKNNKWLKMFRNQYDYIFIDEYQDTSTIQFQILLALNAKTYYVIGDKNQSIYSFSGANCVGIEFLLKKRRDTIEMNLSTNFRSHKSIVENSNLYSSLKAIPFHKEEGLVHKKILTFQEYLDLLSKSGEIVTLARTNATIKQIEKRLLARKFPIRYFNYITPTEIKELQKGECRTTTIKKVEKLLDVFKDTNELVQFVLDNEHHKSFITSIHKAKGREFDTCVIVNSFSPEILKYNNIELEPEQIQLVSFDPNNEEDYESKNIHYVAVSRAKKELYFMAVDSD